MLNVQNINSPNFFFGIAEVMQASQEYERQRGREATVQPNFGLIKYVMNAEGHRAIGACWALAQISGESLGSVVEVRRQAVQEGVLFDLAPVGGGFYLTDEKFVG